VMLGEIVPSLPTNKEDAAAFAHDVLDRYANPYVRHELRSIALQQTSKMRVRVIPSVARYAERFGEAPPLMAFGFAALIALKRRGFDGLPTDDADARWPEHLSDDLAATARAVANDAVLWETPPGQVEGFTDAVAAHLVSIELLGAREALTELLREVAND